MRTMILMAAALAMTACACSVIKGDTGDKGQLIFPHAKHTEEADCGDCHDGIEKNTGSPAGKLIPAGHEKCGECHEVADKAECKKCHHGAREGIAFTRIDRALNFSHEAHAGKRVKACATCHPKDQKGGAVIPGHKTCNTADCHAKQHDKLQCQQCHQDLSRFGKRPIDRLSHGPGFARNHGVQAKQNVKACVQCHDQTYCADCHAPTSLAKASVRFPEHVGARFIHRGDYLTRHAVEARSDPASCRKCHGQRSCRSCHALNGMAVAPHKELPGSRTRNPHPAGWMAPGGGDFHGVQARKDINRCASCHDRGGASNCVSCHKVGGMGGSPHPPGWSWRNKSGQCKDNPMCRTCHGGGMGCQ